MSISHSININSKPETQQSKLDSKTTDRYFMDISIRGVNVISSFPDNIKNNYFFIKDLISIRGEAIEFIEDKFQDMEEIVIESLRSFRHGFKFASQRLKNDKNFIEKIFSIDSTNYQYISEKLKNDIDIASQAVNYNGICLKYLPNKFKQDKQIAYQAVQNNALAIEFIDDSLRNDKELLILSLNSTYIGYKYAPDNLKNDKDVVIALIKYDINALKYVPEKIRNDKSVAIFALEQSPAAFIYLGENLKSDEQIIDKMFLYLSNSNYEKIGKEIFNYLPESKKNNFQFFVSLINKLPYYVDEIVSYIGNALRNDLFAMNYFIHVIKHVHYQEYIGEELKDNEILALSAIMKNTNNLRYMPASLQDNKNLIMAAVSENPDSLQYASNRLKNDKDVVMNALNSVNQVSSHNQYLLYASHNIRNDKDVMLNAVIKDEKNISYLGDNLEADHEFIIELIEQNARAFSLLPRKLKDDIIIAKTAVKADIDNFSNLSFELRNNLEFVYFSYNIATSKRAHKISSYLGAELKMQIQDNEPYAYLKKAYEQKQLEEKLEKELNHTNSQDKRFKI